MKKKEKDLIIKVIKRYSSFIELADGRYLFQIHASISNKELVNAIKKLLTEKI